MSKPDPYVGLDNDQFGGMTVIGKTIRDAWVFGILPEGETCEGWDISRLNGLKDSVDKEWDKYGCMVSQLPEELFKRHQDFHDAAIKKAKELGWGGEYEIFSDE